MLFLYHFTILMQNLIALCGVNKSLWKMATKIPHYAEVLIVNPEIAGRYVGWQIWHTRGAHTQYWQSCGSGEHLPPTQVPVPSSSWKPRQYVNGCQIWQDLQPSIQVFCDVVCEVQTGWLLTISRWTLQCFNFNFLLERLFLYYVLV